MNGKTNIFDVVEQGDVQIFKNCIGKFDINITNVNGLSLLHKAIAYQRLEIAIDLLQQSIDVNVQDNKGQSCLHYLSFHPNLELAKAIILHGGDLELKDNFGNTPLWYAVYNARGNYGLVEFLIQNRANPNSLNNAGRTPLNFASQIKDKKLIQILSR